MPIYEYEPTGVLTCTYCLGGFQEIQSVDDAELTACPKCGEPCKRVISKVQFKINKTPDAEKAAKGGFTTYKKAGDGVWEKTGGEGVDFIVGTDEDKAAVKEEKSAKPVKKIDLDNDNGL